MSAAIVDIEPMENGRCPRRAGRLPWGLDWSLVRPGFRPKNDSPDDGEGSYAWREETTDLIFQNLVEVERLAIVVLIVVPTRRKIHEISGRNTGNRELRGNTVDALDAADLLVFGDGERMRGDVDIGRHILIEPDGARGHPLPRLASGVHLLLCHQSRIPIFEFKVVLRR